MPLVKLKLPSPTELRGGWAALAAVQESYNPYGLVSATEDGWLYDDGGGNWAYLRFVGDDKALLIGHDHEYSQTNLTEDNAADSILLKGAPAWWLENTFPHPLAEGDAIGFVYGWENKKWQRSKYADNDGFDHVGLLDAISAKGRHSIGETVKDMYGSVNYRVIAALIYLDANVSESILSKISDKDVTAGVEAALNFLKAPLPNELYEFISGDLPAGDKNDGIAGPDLLHAAAAANDVMLLEKVLIQVADPNLALRGDTPLMTAAASSSIQAIGSLLNNGADVNGKGKKSERPIHRVRTAVALKALVDGGAKIDIKATTGTAVHHAAKDIHNDYEKGFLEKLIAAGAKPDVKDRDGATALHAAAEYARLDNFRILLKSGWSVDLKDKHEEGVFHYSVRYPYPDDRMDRCGVIEELISLNISPDESRYPGGSARDKARIFAKTGIYREEDLEGIVSLLKLDVG